MFTREIISPDCESCLCSKLSAAESVAVLIRVVYRYLEGKCEEEIERQIDVVPCDDRAAGQFGQRTLAEARRNMARKVYREFGLLYKVRMCIDQKKINKKKRKTII